jgi:hypothetical protein
LGEGQYNSQKKAKGGNLFPYGGKKKVHF